MLPLDPLSLAAAGYMHVALGSCDAQAPPEIKIEFIESPVRTSQPKDADTMHRESKKRNYSPNSLSPDEYAVTGGIAISNISLNHTIEFSGWVNNSQKTTCLWVKKISFKAYFKPEVNIANNYKKKSCRYRSILIHEMRHIAAYRAALENFISRLDKALQQMAKTLPSLGPMPSSNTQEGYDMLEKTIAETVAQHVPKLDEQLKLRNSVIDTAAEYTRVSTLCKHEPLR